MAACWSGAEQEEHKAVLAAILSLPDRGLRATLLAQVCRGRSQFQAKAFPLYATPNIAQALPRYRKLALLLNVTAVVGEGDDRALAVLRAIEGFVIVGQRWLKIASGDKAEVLEEVLEQLPVEAWQVCVELGSFIGYTAVRLGHRQAAMVITGVGLAAPRVVSCEYEMVHVCISRHFVDVAALSSVVEIWPGHVPLVSPKLVEHSGARAAGFQFMDHKGTRFHEDRSDFERLHFDAPLGSIVCDNVLHPGAPEYLWSQVGVRDHSIYALEEFAQPGLEDWQSLRQVGSGVAKAM